jgi:oligo-1,6-glucosidase
MEPTKNWIKDLVIYQVYPRSFQDSNGDGIGDIPGIIQRLDYLSDLGINALWLSPVYCSPNADNGYDISDYQKIMEEFGTMEDWELLCSECHQRNIKLIMDLVVNHSSDEHSWFKESKSSRDNAKSDFYIWRDPKNGKEPNNWASLFGGSAWEYVPERDQYYFHLFSKKQPDLNWANPKLREEIFSMMEWWVKKGVDGFRVDAISYLDKPQDFPDSPEPPQPDGYSFSACLLSGRPGTHAYIQEMNRRVFSPYNVLTVGEVIAPDAEELSRYVVSDRQEFDMAIPFVAPVVEINTWSPKKWKENIAAEYDALKDHGWWARFFSNHDKPRQVSLYGNDQEYWEVSAKMLAMLLHFLPGTPFVYQGEEIGMTNMCFPSIEQYNDPDAKNTYNQLLLAGTPPHEALRQAQMISRDNARTPMQWDGTENAGFTTGKPWLGINPNHRKINVENQKEDPHSIYQCYKTLIDLRKKSPALSRGVLEILPVPTETLFALKRSYQDETLLSFHNFSAEPVKIPEDLLPQSGEVLLSSYDRQGGYQGDNILRPYESVIFRI